MLYLGWLTNLESKTMPRPSNTAVRRSQIVVALSEVMAETGYDGATIQTIAARAGLTPGLVHYHFKSKLEILIALFEHLSNKLKERFEKRMQSSSKKNADAELMAYIDAHLATGEDSDTTAVACWIAIGAEALRQEEIKKLFQQSSEKQISNLEEIIERCLTAQKKKTKAKRAIALGIFAAIEGSYRLIVSAPQLLEAGFAAPTVLQMAKGVISAQEQKT